MLNIAVSPSSTSGEWIQLPGMFCKSLDDGSPPCRIDEDEACAWRSKPKGRMLELDVLLLVLKSQYGGTVDGSPAPG